MSVYSNLKNDTAIYAAKGTGFTTSSDLTSKNVQDAIEEVHAVSNNNDSVSPTNFIDSGRKFGTPSGLGLPIYSGVESIGGKRIDRSDNTVVLDARKAALIYDKKDGTTDALYAVDPITFIDNNTVGLWKPNGDATCPNLAVGVSSIAVANDLTKSGTVTAVDGRDGGYAGKFDGSTGCYTSTNSTNFPIGASEREFNILCAAKSVSDGFIFQCGSFWMEVFGTRIKLNANSAVYDTGYDFIEGQPTLLTFSYDGTTFYLKINGLIVYSLVISLATTSTVLYLFKQVGGYFIGGTVHFVELRNKCRTPQAIAEMAAKLLFPVCYDKSSAVYPTISAADKATA